MTREQSLEAALRDLLIEAKTIAEGESCDHSVGICWCPYFRALENAQAALDQAA